MSATRTEVGWERERERSARTQSEKSRKGRDIGPIPPPADPARKIQGGNSFEFFCRTYFPATFNLPWSQDHRRAIERIETAVREGGLFAYAFPRGSGKTSLAEAAVLWATLYGYRRFPLVIGSDESSALELLESVKSELESNELLLADFPEVCHPIRRLEGIAHRANGQLCDGARTFVEWTAKSIVLPAIKGSAASSAVIAVTGITGRIRGMKFKRPDGQGVRPDLVIIDDPQTDESAKSPSQCQERVRILSGAVLGLAGPGKKISGIMPCTVIRPGDMADEILDRQAHPEWQGERTKLVYAWPEAWDTLWGQYREVRAAGLRAGDGGAAGTAFYAANREAMDKGSEVAWAVRKNPDDLSAIQHAANLRFDLGDPAFLAEYQNDPLDEEDERNEALTADEIAAKANGIDRGVVPLACTKLTSFIDVQGELLYWAVCGWEDDFTGHVVDYGSYPDQKREFFTLADAKRTLTSLFAREGKKAIGLEALIRRGLDDLAGLLLSREWAQQGGRSMKIGRLLVDANWGKSTETVYKWARETPHAAIVTPSHGKYIGAASLPLSEHRKKPGDRFGPLWRMPGDRGNRPTRHVLYDTNGTKTFLHTRFAVPMGGVGGLTLFGTPHDHRMLIAQILSEIGIPTEGRGRRVVEWKIKPSRDDNHLLDALAGCIVGASMEGVAIGEAAGVVVRKVTRVKLSDLQRQKRGAR